MKRCLLCVLVLVAVLAAVGAWALAAGEDNPNPGVIPLSAKVGGLSYGDLGDAWWKWVISVPVAEQTEERMSLGPAYGPVLLLGSTSFTVNSTTPVERWVTVDRGQPLFLPLASMLNGLADACMDGEGRCQEGYAVGDEALVDYLRTYIRTCNDASIVELYATVDGHPLGDLFQYRAWSSQPFAWWYPAGSIFSGGNEGGGELPVAVTDGWYLLLAPLRPGEHVVRFGARSVNPDDASVWCTAILLYHITVK